MIKKLSRVLVVLAVLFGTSSSWAEQGVAAGDIFRWQYKAGGEERFRSEYKENFDLNDAKKDNGNLIFNRARVNLKVSLADGYLNNIMDVFAEGMDCRVGSYQIKQTTQKDVFDLHQGYADIYNILDAPVDFKFGRQELSYGKQRLIAAPSWSNIIRSFDAAVLHIHPGQFYADLIYGRVVVSHPTSFDSSGPGEQLGGIYGGYRKNNTSPLWEGYFLTQVIDTTSTTRRYTVGPRFQINLPQNLSLDIEAPYQFGEKGDTPIRAYAFHVDIAKTFDQLLWRPKVSCSYDQASGNQKPNGKTDNTFIPLYQTVHEPYGIMDFFRWQNVHNPELSVTLNPTEKLRLIPQVDAFWLDSKYDSWYNSTGTALRTNTTGVESSYVGTETSFRVCYDFTKNIKAEIGYAHFFTGGYTKETGVYDAVDWVYSQFTLKY